MKLLKRIAIGFGFLVVIVLLFPVVSGHPHLYKTVANTVFEGRMGPDIDQHDIYEHRVIEAGNPQPWPERSDYNTFALPRPWHDSLKHYQTVSYLVIQHDSVVYERYYEGYDQKTISNSWSMAKSIVGVLIGIAIQEGKIQSVHQKIGDFLPEFREGKKADITIEHCLQMACGIKWGEDYKNPFGYMATTLFGDDVRDITFEYPVEEPPNTVWRYQGGSTLLLSFVLREATGMTMSEYASQKLWQPIGATSDALWSLDHEDGDEKAFCCFTSNARDFARLGRLWMHKGNWNGQQLVAEDYVNGSLDPVNLPDKNGNLCDYYGYQWWMGKHRGMDFYFMRGLQGQYVFYVPEKDMIVVRLGHMRSKERRDGHPLDVYTFLDIGLKVCGE